MVNFDRLRAWSDGETQTNVAGTVTVRPTMLGSTNIGAEIVAPRAGKARRMYARVQVAPGVGETFTFTLMKNGVATALSVVIAGALLKEAENLTDSVSVDEGDKLQVRVTRSTGAAAPFKQRVEMEYV